MWIWSVVASAATPVVFDEGEPVEVVEAVASRTGLPPDQLEAVSLDELLKAPPAALGEGVLRRCTRAGSQRDAVRTELARAEAAWAEPDLVAARDHLDLAVAQLGCLTELPDRAVAARVFLLRAVLEVGSDDEVSRSELRTALAFDPELSVDDPVADTVRFAVAEERQKSPSLSLRVAPATTTSGPWIDGRAIEHGAVQVGEGLHLAQYSGPTGVASAWLVVGGDVTLVVPTSYRRPVVPHIAEVETRSDVEALLAAALPELDAAYVAWSGGLWLLTPEASGVATIEIAPPVAEADPVPDEESGKKGKGKKDKGKKDKPRP